MNEGWGRERRREQRRRGGGRGGGEGGGEGSSWGGSTPGGCPAMGRDAPPWLRERGSLPHERFEQRAHVAKGWAGVGHHAPVDEEGGEGANLHGRHGGGHGAANRGRSSGGGGGGVLGGGYQGDGMRQLQACHELLNHQRHPRSHAVFLPSEGMRLAGRRQQRLQRGRGGEGCNRLEREGIRGQPARERIVHQHSQQPAQPWQAEGEAAVPAGGTDEGMRIKGGGRGGWLGGEAGCGGEGGGSKAGGAMLGVHCVQRRHVPLGREEEQPEKLGEHAAATHRLLLLDGTPRLGCSPVLGAIGCSAALAPSSSLPLPLLLRRCRTD